MSGFCLLQHVLPCQNPNYAMLAKRFMICICLESTNLNSHNRCCGVSNICICTPQNQHSNWHWILLDIFIASGMTNLQGGFCCWFQPVVPSILQFQHTTSWDPKRSAAILIRHIHFSTWTARWCWISLYISHRIHGTNGISTYIYLMFMVFM